MWREVACGGGDSNAPPPAPSATTMDADPITNDNAVLNGDVNPNGLDTVAWFEYGQDSSLSNPTRTDNQAIGSGKAPLSINSTLIGLNAGSTYYYRVAASNSAGTSIGTIGRFTAALLPPTVSTSAANPVSNDNAIPRFLRVVPLSPGRIGRWDPPQRDGVPVHGHPVAQRVDQLRQAIRITIPRKHR
jgi:hypothetical protein